MSLGYDLKAALRIAAKHRVTSLLAIVSMAVGIGSSTGIFSVVDSLFLRPLEISHPDELFEVTSVGEDSGHFFYGWADYEAMNGVDCGAVQLAGFQRRGG